MTQEYVGKLLLLQEEFIKAAIRISNDVADVEEYIQVEDAKQRLRGFLLGDTQ